jgi:hypothetical protein
MQEVFLMRLLLYKTVRKCFNGSSVIGGLHIMVVIERKVYAEYQR